MEYKLVAFVPFNDFILTNYIDNQIKLIEQELNIKIELTDEKDSRMLLYCKKPDRFPCFMIFKNNIHKTHKQAKLSDNELFVWVSENIS